MAKLAHLTGWITQALRGDDARARSIVQLARKARLFATGGRGPGAPEMTSGDGANAVFLTLYDGPPTKCPEVIELVASLEPHFALVSPNGPRGDSQEYFFDPFYGPAQFVPLPSVFADFPTNAWAAVEAILSSPTRPYYRDRVTLALSDLGPEVSVTVHDPDKPVAPGLESERDMFLFTMTFRPPGFTPRPDAGGKDTENSLSGNALDNLYCLLHGIDPEAD